MDTQATSILTPVTVPPERLDTSGGRLLVDGDTAVIRRPPFMGRLHRNDLTAIPLASLVDARILDMDGDDGQEHWLLLTPLLPDGTTPKAPRNARECERSPWTLEADDPQTGMLMAAQLNQRRPATPTPMPHLPLTMKPWWRRVDVWASHFITVGLACALMLVLSATGLLPHPHDPAPIAHGTATAGTTESKTEEPKTGKSEDEAKTREEKRLEEERKAKSEQDRQQALQEQQTQLAQEEARRIISTNGPLSATQVAERLVQAGYPQDLAQSTVDGLPVDWTANATEAGRRLQAAGSLTWSQLADALEQNGFTSRQAQDAVARLQGEDRQDAGRGGADDTQDDGDGNAADYGAVEQQ